mmetsp:Transcript_3562/g.7749  ORF Transcript_3562/g.7749 Transcript_3562/m.7749 type:complete len:115 (-) Transcript_3562:73-417(-)
MDSYVDKCLDVNGHQVLHTTLAAPNPAGAMDPSLPAGRRGPPLVLFEALHTSKDTATYQQMISTYLQDAAKLHERAPGDPVHLPCSKQFVPAYLMMDEDPAEMNGASLAFNGRM